MSAAIQSYETALAVDVHYSKAALQLGAIHLMQGAQHDLTIAKVGGAERLCPFAEALINALLIGCAMRWEWASLHRGWHRQGGVGSWPGWQAQAGCVL